MATPVRVPKFPEHGERSDLLLRLWRDLVETWFPDAPRQRRSAAGAGEGDGLGEVEVYSTVDTMERVASFVLEDDLYRVLRQQSGV
jgi:hypothetical protein